MYSLAIRYFLLLCGIHVATLQSNVLLILQTTSFFVNGKVLRVNLALILWFCFSLDLDRAALKIRNVCMVPVGNGTGHVGRWFLRTGPFLDRLTRSPFPFILTGMIVK